MDFDIIIIGAGHAGIEAALSSARLGCTVLLLTMNLETIAAQPCNPAIGGLAKGHLVKEIDALGGEMAFVADYSSIQYRKLNTRKGPAVQSSRVQTDKWIYKDRMKKTLFLSPNVAVLECEVIELILKGEGVCGVKTKLGEIFNARAVIVTTGTFLNGIIHVGLHSYPAGRLGEFQSSGLSNNLKELGFSLGRLKTGTNPRLDGRTINFDQLIKQDGDTRITPLSIHTREIKNRQLPCFITRTNERTHEIIRSGLDRSPLYTGKITGRGPRYCPSIEDKVVRFSDKKSHQIFLEPEGIDTFEIYANGVSTSLPYDIQQKFIKTIDGLRDAKILKYGYAVEYDFVFPTQLKNTLESKAIKNLFFAGQINGTSGYEEAAALGLIAGINAANAIKEKDPFILKRSEAYIGVLVDDLVTKGTEEPYRMFTSRAEYRLLLREDNAYERLTERGFRLGLVTKEMYNLFLSQRVKRSKIVEYLEKTKINPTRLNNEILVESGIDCIKNQTSLLDLLKRPFVYLDTIFNLMNKIKLDEWSDFGELEDGIQEGIETEIKYSGYLKREFDRIKRMSKIDEFVIPSSVNYYNISGLSNEIKGKLSKILPVTLGQASRIQGVTPAAIDALYINLYRAK